MIEMRVVGTETGGVVLKWSAGDDTMVFVIGLGREDALLLMAGLRAALGVTTTTRLDS